MVLIYTVSAIVACVLIVLSMIGLDHSFGGDVHVDLHADGGHGESGQGGGYWLPFFSLRFYTYFFAAFGTTGLLLHYLTQADPNLTAWISGVVGLLCGLSVSIVIRLLRLSETGDSAKDKDVLGKEGEVLVTIRGTTPGRIRCIVRGDIIDFLAVTEGQETIEVGRPIVVVSMDNGRAQVVPRDSLFDHDPFPKQLNP